MYTQIQQVHRERNRVSLFICTASVSAIHNLRSFKETFFIEWNGGQQKPIWKEYSRRCEKRKNLFLCLQQYLDPHLYNLDILLLPLPYLRVIKLWKTGR